MEVQQLLHMNGGEGKQSYASNSLPQLSMMARTKPYIEEALQKVISTTKFKKLNVADLGCSSGPNALLAVDMILDIVNRSCSQQQPVDPSLELHAFLNDLPGNDFNTVFNAVPSFYRKVRDGKVGTASCFISATPGSFHGRLFPCESLHFAYSANSLHWLSQVPPGLAGENGNLNVRNIGLGKTSPPAVLESYLAQFQSDITAFLKSRSEEIVHGGRMVLLLKGRKSLDNSSDERDALWTTFANAFEELIREGVVEEDKVNSFNMPCYEAYIDELREIIQTEGSFDIVRMEELTYAGQNACINKFNPELVTNSVRAFSEPLLVNHFCEDMMDILFEKFREKFPPNDPLKFVMLVASLARKK